MSSVGNLYRTSAADVHNAVKSFGYFGEFFIVSINDLNLPEIQRRTGDSVNFTLGALADSYVQLEIKYASLISSSEEVGITPKIL